MKTAQQIAQEWIAQMNDHHIRCPNCGSSAQIELTYMDHRSYDTQKTDEYICGCGCHFEVTFEVTEVKVIKNEQ